MDEDLIGDLKDKSKTRGLIWPLIMYAVAVINVSVAILNAVNLQNIGRLRAELERRQQNPYSWVSRAEFDREWKRFGGPWVFTDTKTGITTPAEPLDIPLHFGPSEWEVTSDYRGR
jgi:hypothetical protein